MRSIGIITKISRNYGAVLQAYALKTYLQSRGCDARVIRYDNPKCRQSYRLLERGRSAKALRANLGRLRHMRANLRKTQRFLRFREENLDLTRPYGTLSELQADPPRCDVYVSGSDQVWNPKNDFDPAYFLDFGGPDVMRASYAASIGVSRIDPEDRDAFVEGVSRFDFISVREQSAREILRELGFEARVVLDPTLLLPREAYDRFAKPTADQRGYILCYLMNPPAFAAELVRNIKAALGLPVIVLGGGPYVPNGEDRRVLDAGPEEFVGYMRGAALVVSSSFHAMAFSAIYQRPIAALLHTQTGSRVRDFLHAIGAEDRIAQSAIFDPNWAQMDYAGVERRLEALRKASVAYLDGFLQ